MASRRPLSGPAAGPVAGEGSEPRAAQAATGWVRRIGAGAGLPGLAGARVLAHALLDRHLELLACRPERFATDALRLAEAFDAHGIDLEISDASAWRTASGGRRVAVESQFRVEIEGVRPMDRAEERTLAVRIEFARIRLHRGLERHGLDRSALADGSTLPPPVLRRRLEWHALRLEMVERNLYLVLINVARYRHTSADRFDLMQAAMAPMFRAVDGFDWRRGLLFRTYAVHWLNQGFRNYLYESNRTVRLPAYIQKSIRHIDAAIQRLGDPRASVEEIARESGLRTSVIESARTATRGIRSLDIVLDDVDGVRSLAGVPASQDGDGPYSVALETVSIESGVEAALDTLTDRERHVVEMRFGIGYGRAHVYSEVAVDMGVSLERVRQILVRAMCKMRTPRLQKSLEALIN